MHRLTFQHNKNSSTSKEELRYVQEQQAFLQSIFQSLRFKFTNINSHEGANERKADIKFSMFSQVKTYKQG